MSAVEIAVCSGRLSAALACVLALTIASPAGASSAELEKAENKQLLRVVCATTLLSSIVEAVGRDLVDARAIVPFGMCPGHFEISPGEAERIRNADIILAHGGEPFLEGFGLKPSPIPAPGAVTSLRVDGNWMIPKVHKKAADEIGSLLCVARPENKAFLERNLAEYHEQIDEANEELKKRLEPLRGTAAVASDMNAELVEWMGMKVVATMPRDEDVSLKTMSEIIAAAKAASARLVIDNRQSGGRVGETIAKELSLPLAVLDNFPDPMASGKSRLPYIETIKKNCESVRAALK